MASAYYRLFPITPNELSDSDLGRINPYDWESKSEGFGEIIDRGGFDAVIGNPPYIRAENMEREERHYWQTTGHFKSIYGRFDIFILFIERGLELIRNNGRLGFIVPITLLSQNYAKIIRRIILDNCRIGSIVDLLAYRVFQQATVSTCIITTQKDMTEKSRRANKIRVVRQKSYSSGSLGEQSKESSASEIDQSVFYEVPDNMFRLDMVQKNYSLLQKLAGSDLTIGDLCHVNPGLVPHDSATGASKDRLIHDRKINNKCKPYLESKEAPGRYGVVRTVRYIEYAPEQMHRGKFPELFENPKILVQDIIGGAGRLIATFDDTGVYTNHSFNICILKHFVTNNAATHVSDAESQLSRLYDTQFILGVLNSRLATFYFRTAIGGGLHASPANIRSIPIKSIDFSKIMDKKRHDDIANLANRMLALHSQKVDANSESLRVRIEREINITDEKIDELVYELYSLTDAEIKNIESAHD